jgi:dTDP-4-amino-4,6-dideoxygalactose transaminase
MTEQKRLRSDRSAVPLVDLHPQNDTVMEEVLSSFGEICRDGAFVLGAPVVRFEDEYAAFCGVEHCVGVGNGTDALELAMLATGIGRGDEVIVPANTFVATAEAVARVGAQLVVADCAHDFLIDPGSVATKLTARTRAVVGVDLYGQIAPFDQLREVVGGDVVLIEDAAQSQGADRHGRAGGSFGSVAATSFYPGKNLGAFGDAGAVTTDDAEIADRVRALRNHGGIERYQHLCIGTNSRLDSLQAAVLSIKLERLKAWNAERSAAAEVYGSLLADLPAVTSPLVREGNSHVWHLYVVRVPRRDAVAAVMGSLGIGTGIHYPTPVHMLPAFAHLGLGAGTAPVAESLSTEIMSLPMYPGITVEQQVRVVDALRSALVETSGTGGPRVLQ